MAASGPPAILRMERLNYVLGGVLVIAAALTQTRPIALGVAIGVALTCANFYLLRRLVTRWIDDAARGVTSRAGLLVIPKLVGLMIAVGVALLVLPIDPIAFTVGYSIFIASILIETVFG